MTLATLITKPCTLHIASPAGTADIYGNANTTYADVATVCELQKLARRASEEPADQGEMSDTLWSLFLLPGTELGERPTANKITVDGDTYEFVGKPWEVWHPRRRTVSHIEASVRETA